MQFDRVEALKRFSNIRIPDDAKVDVSTRQLFTFLTQKLKLYSVAPLQNRKINPQPSKSIAIPGAA
jgi:hypothetical protein